MKYKVTLKISHEESAFVFSDRLEAMDFMETAWGHRMHGKAELEAVRMELIEEDKE